MDKLKIGAAVLAGIVVGGFGMGLYSIENPNIVTETNTITKDVKVPTDFLEINGMQLTVEDFTSLQEELANVITFDDYIDNAKDLAEEELIEKLDDYNGEHYKDSEIEVEFEKEFLYYKDDNGDYKFGFTGTIYYDDDEDEQNFRVTVDYDKSRDKFDVDIL